MPNWSAKADFSPSSVLFGTWQHARLCVGGHAWRPRSRAHRGDDVAALLWLSSYRLYNDQLTPVCSPLCLFTPQNVVVLNAATWCTHDVIASYLLCNTGRDTRLGRHVYGPEFVFAWLCLQSADEPSWLPGVRSVIKVVKRQSLAPGRKMFRRRAKPDMKVTITYRRFAAE